MPNLWFRSCVAETDELNYRAGREVDRAAVGRAGRDAPKDADAPVIAFGNAIKLPLEYCPHAEIAAQHRWRAVARWTGERDAVWRAKRKSAVWLGAIFAARIQFDGAARISR